MVIQAMLVVALVGVLLLFTRREHGVRMQVGKRLAFVAFIGLNVYGVLRPDDLTRIANHLGVGRGADLLLYGLAMAAILLVVNTGLRFRAVDRQFTELVRAFALYEAEVRHPRPATPAPLTSPPPLAPRRPATPPPPNRMPSPMAPLAAARVPPATAPRSSVPLAGVSTPPVARDGAAWPSPLVPPAAAGPAVSLPMADALPRASEASTPAAGSGSRSGPDAIAVPERASAPAAELGPVPSSAGRAERPSPVVPPAGVGQVIGTGASLSTAALPLASEASTPVADSGSDSGPDAVSVLEQRPAQQHAADSPEHGLVGHGRRVDALAPGDGSDADGASTPAVELGPVPWSAAALRSAVPWSPSLARALATSSRPRSWASRAPMPPGSTSRRGLPSWRTPGSTDPDA